ncbi:unnamed protein product [Nesidiocoris tenuis]|uniref:Uncharacterized protein n=1 Tax=Nesidiocoris tenuis TaxID=355587 RepID=A0A6H5G0N3_9HEMI|nr:unnamed protein product [Nesidiocoris tenuis]
MAPSNFFSSGAREFYQFEPNRLIHLKCTTFPMPITEIPSNRISLSRGTYCVRLKFWLNRTIGQNFGQRNRHEGILPVLETQSRTRVNLAQRFRRENSLSSLGRKYQLFDRHLERVQFNRDLPEESDGSRVNKPTLNPAHLRTIDYYGTYSAASRARIKSRIRERVTRRFTMPLMRWSSPQNQLKSVSPVSRGHQRPMSTSPSKRTDAKYYGALQMKDRSSAGESRQRNVPQTIRDGNGSWMQDHQTRCWLLQ